MAFAKKNVTRFPAWRGAARLPLALFVRTLIFGAIAIVGAAWALVRHFTHELPPLRPPPPAATYDADAGEIPAPELILSGSSR